MAYCLIYDVNNYAHQRSFQTFIFFIMSLYTFNKKSYMT